MARRVWKEFAHKGYGLSNVCKFLDFKFKHHDALEDARASGHILISAIKESAVGAEEWCKKVKQPIDGSVKTSKIKKDGNPDGPLFGEVVVFTGALEIPRREASEMAAKVGCQVAPNVTKKTTILVVGDQDLRVVGDKSKSSKHQKAEELIAKGVPIRVLGESDFGKLVELNAKIDY